MNEPEKVTGDSLIIPGKRRGRPRSEERGSTVSAWLTEQQHDRLIKLAAAERKSVSALVKALLMLRIR